MDIKDRVPSVWYVNYFDFFARFDTADCSVYCGSGRDFARIVLKSPEGKTLLPGDFTQIKPFYDFNDFVCGSRSRLAVTFTLDDSECVLHIDLSRERATVYFDGTAAVTFDAELFWGDCFAASRNASSLRCSCGPAVLSDDNALFDRASGDMLLLDGTLCFNWQDNHYHLSGSKLGFGIERGIITREYGIPYTPVNPVLKPTVGWMTWYAVGFGATEDVVLNNARWMHEHLQKFGADTIWIDWEWYHTAFNLHTENIDIFRPCPDRYPSGMKALAEKLEALGQIPAIWISPTNEPSENSFILSHPEAVLRDRLDWCGSYFFDLTHPNYFTYLKAAAECIKEWGYKAVKWDALPTTLICLDENHQFLHDPSLTSEQALRAAVMKAREYLGKDFYMLSCYGATDRDVLFASDLFDAARIGGDIFKWEEFRVFCVERVLHFYPLHNTQLFCDADNLVIRPEYNTMEQAISRISFITLLGLPVTMGDSLPDLPAEYASLLPRCMPPADIRPNGFTPLSLDGDVLKINLAVARRFGCWNVVDLLNLSDAEQQVSISPAGLGLPDGEYIVFDYWNNRFVGVLTSSLSFTLAPYASVVLRVTRMSGVPQVISTSRHITQGAVDLLDTYYDPASDTLNGVSAVVAHDLYTVTVYNPADGAVTAHTFSSDINTELNWEIKL